MRILAIIPARAGSKGVPNKNLLSVGGVPLVGRAIQVGLGASCRPHIVVSTDSPQIAEYATRSGVPTPLLRPAELSSDDATTASVVQYELTRTSEETGQTFDHILLLQPTAPLRKVSHVDAAMARYSQSGASSLVSVCDVGGLHPDCMYRQNGGFLEKLTPSRPGVRRQNFEPLYIRNGAIYIVSVAHFIQTGQLVSDNPAYYQMDRADSINIDEPIDLSFAEVLIKIDD